MEKLDLSWERLQIIIISEVIIWKYINLEYFYRKGLLL